MSKCLDDRAGILAILQALRQLDRKQLAVNVAVLFSCQEEVTSLGALTGCVPHPSRLRHCGGCKPRKNPGRARRRDFRIRRRCNDRHGSEHEYRPYPRAAAAGACRRNRPSNRGYGGQHGHNAWEMQIAACGTAQAILSIPLRYMHTPIEAVKLSDIDATADLIAAFLKSFNGEALY